MTSRRHVLFAAIASLGAVLGGSLGLYRASSWSLVALPLWGGLDHLDDFRVLGEASLKEVPGLGVLTADDLMRQLADRLTVDIASPVPLIKRAFKERIAEDFRREESVSVDGWRLSKTEVLLAALARKTFG